MKWGLITIVAAGILLSLAVPVSADTLKTKDGRVFEGKVLEQDDKKVIFEVHRFGATARMTFRRHEIAEITTGAIKIKPVKPAKIKKDASKVEIAPVPAALPIIKYDKPTYYIIPFEGEVGTEVLATRLERSFEDALKRKPTVVLIVFDSPGGLVQEVSKLVAVIKKYNGRLRVVAYVRSALSAAAITSLACREIYLEPHAIIGAATAYRMTAFGMPEAISEKFQSVWRAQARIAAEIGGHSTLVAEAMIDAEMELTFTKDADGDIIIESGSRNKGRRTKDKSGKKTLTTKGKLLTLTASEAVNCGLGESVVDDYDQLGKKIGFTGWVECKGHAVPLAEHWKKSLSVYMKQINNLGQEFNRNMKKVMENNPETPKIRYSYYRRTGRYTPESRRRWRNLSRRQAAWLMRAEKNVIEAIELVKKLEQLSSVAENLEDLLKHIKDARMDVIRDMNKKGPDD